MCVDCFLEHRVRGMAARCGFPADGTMRMLGLSVTRALLLSGVAVAALAAACGGGGIKDAEEVVVAGRIEFTIPGAMDEVGVAGIDSVVGQWESAELSLLLDYGTSTNSLGYTSKVGYRLTVLTINDRKAIVERFEDPQADVARPYVTAVYFEDAGDGNRLTMFGRAATEADQDLLLDIYKTLKFKDPKDA
jgi:hypothetical protein